LEASSLSAVDEKDLASLARYLAVGEPVVDLLPEHFIPDRPGADIDATALHQIAVAGKLIYAQIRWLDEFSDARPPAGDLTADSPVTIHPLNGALFDLIRGTFESVLDRAMVPTFFSTLSGLYVRFAASLAVDSSFPGTFPSTMAFEHYASQAKARAAPVRAPVEAVLLLSRAAPEEVERARFCFETSAVALQLLDDALDIEEDFRDRRLSWAVHRTLALWWGAKATNLPDPRAFYELALSGGVIVENLQTTERLFQQSAVAAQDLFPSWVRYSHQLSAEAQQLRIRFQSLASNHS
jgi:hypothetical protein